MRELIDELKKIKYELSPDMQEVADFSKQYGFGSVAWQDAMIGRLKRKIKAGETLSSMDLEFVETQKLHNRRLYDELKAMGADKIGLN